MAVVSLVVPPISLASALVAIAFSGVGWQRARHRGEANPVAKFCLAGCVALVGLVIMGNAIYSAAD